MTQFFNFMLAVTLFFGGASAYGSGFYIPLGNKNVNLKKCKKNESKLACLKRLKKEKEEQEKNKDQSQQNNQGGDSSGNQSTGNQNSNSQNSSN